LNSNLTLWQQKMQIEASTYGHGLMRSYESTSDAEIFNARCDAVFAEFP